MSVNLPLSLFRNSTNSEPSVASIARDLSVSGLIWTPPADSRPTQSWGEWAKQMAIHTWITRVACSDTTQEKRKTEIREWLGLREVDSLTKSFVPLLKPYVQPKSMDFDGVKRIVQPPVELSDDHIERLVTLAIHSLAKRTVAITGKERINLSEMVHTLTTIISAKLPDIFDKIVLHKHDLEAHSHVIMEPLVRELLDTLFPANELGVSDLTQRMFNGLTTFYKPAVPLPEYPTPIDVLVSLIANFDVLQKVIEFRKAYDNVDNREILRAQSPKIVAKIDEAKDPAVIYIRKRLAKNSDTISKLLFKQFAFDDPKMLGWWNEQVELFISGNPGQVNGDAASVLLPFAVNIMGETALNMLLVAGGDTEEGHKTVLDGVTKIITYAAKKKDSFRNFDPAKDNQTLFKPIARIVMHDFQLRKPGVLALPKFLGATKLLEELMPLILCETYAGTMLNDVRQFEAGTTQIEPVVSRFSNALAKLTTKTTMDIFWTDEGRPTEQIAKHAVSVAGLLADNEELKDFLPLNAKFWNAALCRVTSNKLKEPIAQWVESYSAHASKVVFQTLLETLRATEANDQAVLRFKQAIVRFVRDYVKARIRGKAEAFDEERFKLACKNISGAFKGILALKAEQLPFPIPYQDILWDSIVPMGVGLMLQKYCTSEFVQHQLAELVLQIHIEDEVRQDLPEVARRINSPDFLKDCNDLVKQCIQFTDVPFARYKEVDDEEGYRFILTAMYELLGPKVMDPLLDTKLSEVVTASLASTLKPGSDEFKDWVPKPPHDLPKVTSKKVEEAIESAYKIWIKQKEDKIDEFITYYFGDFAGDIVKDIVRVLRIICKFILKLFAYPLMTIFYYVSEMVHIYTFKKADAKADYGFVEGIAMVADANVTHAAAAPGG